MSIAAGTPLRVLLLEDSALDAELLLQELSRSGYTLTWTRVDNAPAMREALQSHAWDIVVSDYSMPTLTAPAALTLLRELGSDLPFIIVSGTIGEETAVSALKAGACDFLVKGRLARLVPTIEREVREASLRRERARTQATLEAQLRQAQKMEAVGQLAGGIAHDFNNLLTAILGYCELLSDQIGPDKPVGRDVREIATAAQRAAALTRQLLAFSRKQVLTVGPLDLNSIVRGIEGMLRRLIGEQITVRTILADDLHTVIADATQIEQVLLNLAVNARDAMPRGGELTIRTWNTDGASADPLRVSLSVTDTGTGIPDEIRHKVFEPFFTTKERGHGTGLGLAAVHGIVTQLRGTIALQTAVGHGSIFRVDLPASRSQAVATVAPVTVAPRPGGEHILLVEDEQGVRLFIERALTRYGYHVLLAESAEAAIALVAGASTPIDLLLTDVVLPKMDGRELAACLHQSRPRLPTLFMSGYTEQMVGDRGVLDSGAELLEKPFTANVLLTRVRHMLDAVVTS